MNTATTERERPATAMTRFLAISMLALALLLAFGPPALAQQVCMERGEISSLLGDRYQESRVAGGLSSNGRLIEVYASGDGATWTMVTTTPQGQSCVVASGEAWAERLQAKTGPAA